MRKMKKLLCISAFALVLTACTQENEAPQEQSEQEVTDINMAGYECGRELGANNDVRDPKIRAEFDACMSKKGFERTNVQSPAYRKKK